MSPRHARLDALIARLGAPNRPLCLTCLAGELGAPRTTIAHLARTLGPELMIERRYARCADCGHVRLALLRLV